MDRETDDQTSPGDGAPGVSELRITVARSGGVAGVRPSWTVTASEEPDVDSWLALVESCPWEAPDADGAGADGGGAESDGAPGAAGARGAAGGADRFVYTIRVLIDPAHEPAEERDAEVPERAIGPWRDLIDRVKDASRR